MPGIRSLLRGVCPGVTNTPPPRAPTDMGSGIPNPSRHGTWDTHPCHIVAATTRMVGKRAVCILLKCFLVHMEINFDVRFMSGLECFLLHLALHFPRSRQTLVHRLVRQALLISLCRENENCFVNLCVTEAE